MIDLTDLAYEQSKESDILRHIFDIADPNAPVYPIMRFERFVVDAES